MIKMDFCSFFPFSVFEDPEKTEKLSPMIGTTTTIRMTPTIRMTTMIRATTLMTDDTHCIIEP